MNKIAQFIKENRKAVGSISFHLHMICFRLMLLCPRIRSNFP